MTSALLLLAGAAHAAPPLEPGDCHKIGRLYASEVASPALLTSPLHKVARCVRIIGHMAQFELETPYGDIEAEGVEMLAIRVSELPALDALEKATRAGTYGDAMKASAQDKAHKVEKIALNPVDTVTHLPEGAWRFFQRTLAKIGDTARDLADRAKRTGEESSPYSDVAPPAVETNAPPEPTPWYAKGANGAKRLTLDWIGYNKTRRGLAERLEVDPYSTLTPLKDRLDALSWSSFAGEKTLSAALGFTGSIATKTLSVSSRVDKVVWNLDPEEIANRNLQRLTAYDCPEEETRRFVRRGHFSPTLQSAFTDQIVALEPESGCAELVELASYARSELETRYLVDALKLLAHFHTDDAENKRLVLIGTGLALETGKGARATLVLPLPVDRLEWKEYTKAYFDLPEFRRSNKTLLVSGTITKKAVRELTRRGWSLIERVPYAGAPPYAS